MKKLWSTFCNNRILNGVVVHYNFAPREFGLKKMKIQTKIGTDKLTLLKHGRLKSGTVSH